MNDEQYDPPWLTYAEAGERLGLSADAVRVRAVRGKWPRMRANTGRTLVQVPADPNEQYPVRSFARTGPIAALQEAVTALREQLQRSDRQIEAERTRTAEQYAQLTEQLAAERTEQGRLYTQLEGERTRTGELYGQLSTAEERAREAEQAARIALGTVETLRRADEARKARGRLRRAWDGLRGR
jgi:hypothetical protein